MHPSFPLLLLSLTTLILPLSAVAASPPPRHQSYFTKRHVDNRTSTSSPPQKYVEITRPLPFSSLTPSCTLPIILSHNVASTTYSPPTNCTWTHVALHLSSLSNGSHYERIAALWLSGAEILRTSAPEPSRNGILWNVHNDITKYSSLLHQTNLTLSITGINHFNLTFLYYNETNAVNSPLSENTILQPTFDSGYGCFELNENPADLIIPISATRDEGSWFKIERESDIVYQKIQIPLNTYRAVIEVYASPHGNDEFWYSNPPDSYIELNNLPTRRGHGAYREVLVKLDDNVVGSVIPFPVISTGGINPLFWEPVVSIGAFDLPSYEIELTPFLGMLLDEEVHYLGLGVDCAISFWLMDANLHLWLDDKVERVQAGGVKYKAPTSSVERESKFQLLDGKFDVEGETKSEFSGWVNSSAGNFTTCVSHESKFANTIKFKNNGSVKEVKQKVKVKSEVRIESDKRNLILTSKVERKYPLEMKTVSFPGSVKDTYLIMTRLEHSLMEENSIGSSTSNLDTNQKSSGWMFVQGKDVLSGAASTHQRYAEQDSFGCYSRSASASNGHIKDNTISTHCKSST